MSYLVKIACKRSEIKTQKWKRTCSPTSRLRGRIGAYPNGYKFGVPDQMEILVSQWILDGLKNINKKSLKCNVHLKNFCEINPFTNFEFLSFFSGFFTCVRGHEGQGLAHQVDWIQKSSLFETVLHKLQSIKGHHRVKVAVDTNYKQKQKNQWLFRNFNFIKNPKVYWDKRFFI